MKANSIVCHEARGLVLEIHKAMTFELVELPGYGHTAIAFGYICFVEIASYYSAIIKHKSIHFPIEILPYRVSPQTFESQMHKIVL